MGVLGESRYEEIGSRRGRKEPTKQEPTREKETEEGNCGEGVRGSQERSGSWEVLKCKNLEDPI